VHGKPGAKIGFVAAGKNWLDLVWALDALGIDEAEAERLGITTYKVGQTWPLDMKGFKDWAEGLELIVVVEEKRKLIEVQVKEAIFDDRRGRRVYGYKDGQGDVLFQQHYSLDPTEIALKLGRILTEEGRGTDRIGAGMARWRRRAAPTTPRNWRRARPISARAVRTTPPPRCPRARSRARASAVTSWRNGWTARPRPIPIWAAKGANWIGEAPFSKRKHVFQNLGEGTYNHSGILAIRAAVAAKANITYKILFNDAVAMTGGQPTRAISTPRASPTRSRPWAWRTSRWSTTRRKRSTGRLPQGTSNAERDDLMKVQERFQELEGVSAIIYIQTCAAEKRRRRKRGTFPDIDKRVFINTDVCEGCGDCGVQSNCVSIVPVETELGRKRAIDQSTCNKDFSCLKGFCPSFVTVEGGTPKKGGDGGGRPVGPAGARDPAIDGTHNIVITGVGGTGVVTIGANLAMAAHIEGKGAAMMEMAGLAQKGGAVHIHVRIAESPRTSARSGSPRANATR
jgi:indolepyruvate ferredoxin oxidoreductase